MLKILKYGFMIILTLTMGFGLIDTAAAQDETRPLRGRRGLRGEISGINDEVLTIEVGNQSIQIVIDEETHFRIIGQTSASLDEFSVGDIIIARGHRQADDSLLATLVLLQPEGDLVLGRIAMIDEDGLLLNGRDQQAITVNVNPDTIVAMRGEEFTWAGDPAGQDMLREGLAIVAFGTASEDGLILEAHTLISQHPHPPRRGVAGTIEAFEEDGFVMTTLRGNELTILVTDFTHYRLPNIEEPSLDDFSVGSEVLVFGQPGAEDTLTARIVASVPEDRPRGRPLAGEINQISGDEIEMTTLRGDLMTVITDEATIFRIGQDNEATLGDFSTGDKVAVFGTRGEEDGTILASHVMKRGKVN